MKSRKRSRKVGKKTTKKRSRSRRYGFNFPSRLPTASTFFPPGTMTRSAEHIARIGSNREYAPKGLGSAILWITYYINRNRRGIPKRQLKQLEKARLILQKKNKSGPYKPGGKRKGGRRKKLPGGKNKFRISGNSKRGRSRARVKNRRKMRMVGQRPRSPHRPQSRERTLGPLSRRLVQRPRSPHRPSGRRPQRPDIFGPRPTIRLSPNAVLNLFLKRGMVSVPIEGNPLQTKLYTEKNLLGRIITFCGRTSLNCPTLPPLYHMTSETSMKSILAQGWGGRNNKFPLTFFCQSNDVGLCRRAAQGLKGVNYILSVSLKPAKVIRLLDFNTVLNYINPHPKKAIYDNILNLLPLAVRNAIDNYDMKTGKIGPIKENKIYKYQNHELFYEAMFRKVGCQGFRAYRQTDNPTLGRRIYVPGTISRNFREGYEYCLDSPTLNSHFDTKVIKLMDTPRTPFLPNINS